jgi:hypothetical protein
MNLKQLEVLVAELRLAPPRPVALWFVDMPTKFNWLLKVAGDKINHLAFPFRFCGIPMYNVRTDHSPQDKFYVTPIYQKPGVWVEMSDGNHHRVRLVDE